MNSDQRTYEFTPRLPLLASVLVAGGLLALLGTTMTGVTLPAISGEFGVTVASGQAVTTAYLLVSAISIPVGGWASVRFGLRRTWLVSLSLFLVGAAGSALAPSLGWLVVARAVQGAGGALEPVMLSALAQAAGRDRVGRMMGVVSAVMAIGPLAGPFLGGALVATSGWRSSFWVVLGAGVLVLLASFVVVRGREPGTGRLDLVGLLLLSVGLVGVLHGITVRFLPTLVVGVLVLAVFVWWSLRRRSSAIVDVSVFRQRGFTAPVVVMALVGAAVYPVFFAVPQYFQDVAGLSALTAGLLLIPYGVGTLVVMPIAGALADRMDPRALVISGALLAAAGFGILLIGGPGLPVVVFVVVDLVVGLGLGAVASPTVTAMYRSLPAESAPTAGTILFVMNQLGGAIGVAVLVLVIGSAGWTTTVAAMPFWMPLVVAVAIALVATRFRGGRPLPAEVD
ncbi:DHA2 family efflux MFS transporter permease subunit [Nakamurella sp. YIM 132087]|uniref:DHA2 family efflux MFS transporter permease subunit n=1 Tax=Nakamurella alba TaxID=2665158 RepID=A0A7K1FT72_9ACTN|nr:DHA2 family efflux MFS transporter permease subunit [Nakamurella alba]MTD16589.1 DHA2 family efflux MFS transporter permease subunit [Nakamurella alba]